MSTIHATLTPRADWEINVKHSWRNPPNNFYEATAIWETNVTNSWRNPPQNLSEATASCPKTTGDCETNVKNCLGNTPKNLSGGESHVLQRTQEDKRAILPEDLYYG